MTTTPPNRTYQPEAGPSRISIASTEAHTSRGPGAIQDDVPAPSQEVDDLLLGLGSDDLNDFDGLDEHDIGSTASRPFAGISKDGGQGPLDDFGTAFGPFVPMSAGFTTGKGRSIAPPSKAAQDRARQILEDIDNIPLLDEEEENHDSRNAKRRRIEEDDTDDAFQEDPAPDFTLSESAGFMNGRGKTLPPPSTEALKKAHDIMSAVSDDAAGDEPQATPTAAPRQVSAFTTGSGNAIAGPSRAAVSRAALLFADDADPTGPQGSQAHLETPMRPSLRPAGNPTEARERALAIFGEDDGGPSTKPAGSMLPPLTSTPSRPFTTGFATPRALPPPMASPAFRTPLRPTTNTFSQSQPSSVPRMMSRNMKPIEIKTPPQPMRRAGMGLTPMRGKTKRTFVTPFKDGSKLSSSPLKTATTPRTSLLPASTLAREVKEPVPSVPVFDLTIPDARKNAKDAYLYPQFTSAEELKEMGLPDEIWQLDLENALSYRFIAEDATVLNHYHALTILKRDGCHLASKKWVDNHWSLILWKLAGQVQAQPRLYDDKWNWGELIAQLKYRYEREYGQAQRPIVRRIQEHDSSPSLPMILCVAAVRWVTMPIEAGDEPVPPRPYLELTDGWYKIVAEVDDCLKRAVEKGLIKTGRKLAISGAKLDSGAEGADVLEAFDKSRLVISGNSTSLARWHAKMGLQPEPFVAGLSSLSQDGGAIMLMDIVIDKLYPIAYLNGQKGSREAPWNEEEERTRADEWEKRYATESGALRETLRKRLEGIEDLVESLVSAAQDVSDPVMTTPPDDLEAQFDVMLTAPDASARIRQLTSGNLVHLASYARNRMAQEIADGQAEIEGELQTVCPPRDVRDFRIARISDAREGFKDPARVGLLNIWEVKNLGEGVLKEGGRYLVSNLIPGRQGDWSSPRQGGALKEVYLHTNKSTRWKAVDERGGDPEQAVALLTI